MSKTLEEALGAALKRAEAGAPQKLAHALQYAVFPGGARVRPRLCLAVAQACGDSAPELSVASAAALELLHCASLVHDDLPCFDNAAVRRGKPSVHRAFGEPVALLAGDAMIVLAFELLGRAGATNPSRLPALTVTLAQAVGSPFGIVAGQAWEAEASVPIDTYHQTKTGSLFTAATMMGALAAGEDPLPWRTMGEKLGAAYQVADDLLDCVATVAEAGKPTRRDVALDRPNAVSRLGVEGAVSRLERLVGEAVESVPECPGRQGLRNLVMQIADRLVPESLRAA